jgi:hypothetical protein
MKNLRVLLCSFSRPFVQQKGPYMIWTGQMREGLESLGCEVIEPQTVDLIEPFLHQDDEEWLSLNVKSLTSKLYDEIKSLHRQKPLDLIFGYFWGFQVDAKGMREITDLGIPTVNFFCDNTRDIESISALFHSFTLHWVPEVSAIPFYEKASAPFINLPMAVSPTKYFFCEKEEVKEVVFMGSADVTRRHLLAQVRDHIPLRVGGLGWSFNATTATPSRKIENSAKTSNLSKKIVSPLSRIAKDGLLREFRRFYHRKVDIQLLSLFHDIAVQTAGDNQMLERFWSSAVTLGINRFPTTATSLSKPITYSRLRDLEAPMAGAVYLAELTDDLPRMFDLENEIWTYRDADELVSKCKRLLSDRSLRGKLRKAARERCFSEHTWKHRFQTIFKRLNIDI